MKIFIFITLIFSATFCFGQMVKGRVIDSKSKTAMSGGTIIVKGTIRGVAIDSNGGFQINLSQGDTLAFYYITYPKHFVTNISLTKDTNDIGLIEVIPAETDFVTYRKGLFRRKVKSNCEIESRYDKIKDKDLVIKDENDKVKYIWFRKSIDTLELDFNSIKTE